MPWEGETPGRSLLLPPASPPTGPHVRPPLLHPLPGQLLHHPACRPPEDSEQEPGHEGELKWGSVGAWTFSPPWLHPMSPTPQFRPDSGVSPHSLELGVWDRAQRLLLEVHVLMDPCWSHPPAARSTLHLLSWLHSTSNSRMLGAATPLPWTGVFSGCCCCSPPWGRAEPLTALGCSRLPLFPPALHPAQLCVVRAEALGQPHPGVDSRGAPAPPHLQSPGKGQLGHGRGGSSRSLVQASRWSCASSTLGWNLLRCENKGKELPRVTGPAWEQLPHSALQLWFIRNWVLTQPP